MLKKVDSTMGHKNLKIVKLNLTGLLIIRSRCIHSGMAITQVYGERLRVSSSLQQCCSSSLDSHTFWAFPLTRPAPSMEQCIAGRTLGEKEKAICQDGELLFDQLQCMSYSPRKLKQYM